MPREITAITSRFGFCIRACNPAEDTNSILWQRETWKANPDRQAALADAGKD